MQTSESCKFESLLTTEVPKTIMTCGQRHCEKPPKRGDLRPGHFIWLTRFRRHDIEALIRKCIKRLVSPQTPRADGHQATERQAAFATAPDANGFAWCKTSRFLGRGCAVI